jgi:RNA polymerase sigma factor (sigma-70 family)
MSSGHRQATDDRVLPLSGGEEHTEDESAEPIGGLLVKRSGLRAVRRLDDVGLPAQDSDESLVARARIGDRGAFAELWRRHARSGIRVARQFTSSIEADDLVAEAYTRIYGRVLAGGGPVGAFRPYLYTTIRNLASRWGQANREVQVDDIDDFEDPRAEDDPVSSTLDRTLTADAFRTLPERWQSVLWYTEVEGMDPHEVAPLLGLSANGVAALSYRAREGLRKAWLQAHISDTAVMGECRWTVARLGDYTRNGLTDREHRRVDAHLTECAKCSLLSQEVDEVGSQLAMVLLPLLFGATIGGSLLAAFSTPGTATAAGLAAAPALPAILQGAAHGAVAAVSTPAVAASAGAAMPASLVGTLTLALVVSGGLAVGISHDAGPAPQQSTSARPYSGASEAALTPGDGRPGGEHGSIGGAAGVLQPGSVLPAALPDPGPVSGLGATVGSVVGSTVGSVVGGVTDAAGTLLQSVTSPLNTFIPSLPPLSAPAPEQSPSDGTTVPLLSNTLGVTVELFK